MMPISDSIGLQLNLTTGDIEMAQEQKDQTKEFTTLERGYIKLGLEGLKMSLARTKTKEVPGSDIWNLRNKEIDIITNILVRL